MFVLAYRKTRPGCEDRVVPEPSPDSIPSSLRSPRAALFWLAVLFTGVSAGISAALLTRILQFVQHLAWGGSGTDLLTSVQSTSSLRRVAVLIGAGVVTGLGQIVLKNLSSGNGIDTTAAIWFHAGRLPAVRTLGSALLSVVIVGMGASLGREGAPKQAGAVSANLFAGAFRLSDEQRRLLVACGAGAGMGAAYGVPVGGALFALEVMRGMLALRYVLPAVISSIVAVGVAWLVLPDAPTYLIPAYRSSASVLVWALLAGPLAGVYSVGYVRLVTWAERHKPKGWQRILTPVIGLGALGILAIWFPEVLGNGKDISQLIFSNQTAPLLLLILMLLKPFATILCIRSGAPGGLFTPSLTAGALLGAILGQGWSLIWPGVPPGFFALLGAGAVLAATTQGPISTVVLIMELTGRDRSFILPLIVIAATATLVARSLDARSIYDARLTDEEIQQRQYMRDHGQMAATVT